MSKLKPIQKTSLIKDCKIELKRLSRRTIKRYLDPDTITYNISAKINKDIFKINKTIIKTTDNTFNIDVKMNATGISVKPTTMPVSSRILRPRPAVVSTSNSKNLKNNRKPDLIVVKSQSKNALKIVEDSWQRCKLDYNQNGKNIRVNDILMAKLKGHKPWPAIALEFVSDTKVFVKFFGAKESEQFGFVNVAELVPFKNSINVIQPILLILKRDIDRFRKGIREAELMCGIPSNLSVLHNM